jgi:hypothetical protein
MTDDQGEIRPQENIVKQSIEELVQVYTDVKGVFFLSASKVDNIEAEGKAAESFSALISILHSLLELCKPDNVDYVGFIIAKQKQLEMLDQVESVGETEIEFIRDLCAWTDTTILRPHLKTQPNIARCISHTNPTVN